MIRNCNDWNLTHLSINDFLIRAFDFFIYRLFFFIHSRLNDRFVAYQFHFNRRFCRKDKDNFDILTASVWHALRFWFSWTYCLLEIIVHIMLLLLAIKRMKLQSHFDFHMINSIVLFERQFSNVTFDFHDLSLLSRCFCRMFFFSSLSSMNRIAVYFIEKSFSICFFVFTLLKTSF